jgi:hypothetical protein
MWEEGEKPALLKNKGHVRLTNTRTASRIGAFHMAFDLNGGVTSYNKYYEHKISKE